MSIAATEKIVDGDIIAEYAFEIFVYWLQHFRFGFKGEQFDIVDRLGKLEDFFKEHHKTKDRWEYMEDSQRKYINRLLEAAGKPSADFAKAPNCFEVRVVGSTRN